MAQMDNINIRVTTELKNEISNICKNEDVKLSNIIRDYLNEIVQNGSTKIIKKSSENNDFKFIINTMQKDTKSILTLLASQLEEKDTQLKSKDKLIENMQVLMKEEQQLLKDEKNKNVLLLNNKNKTSWFSFLNKKNTIL